jgi:hypothetical protein
MNMAIVFGPRVHMDCVNLRETFGRKWQISWDPAYNPRYLAKDNFDPWMMQIPCRGGITIYPHGGSKLAIECDYHPQIARQLGSIPGVELIQDGDHEKTFVFYLSLIDQVADIVQPRRRRQLSDDHRERLTASGKSALEKYRRNPNSGAQISVLKPLGKV